MAGQGWVALLNDQWQIGAGTTLNTATTATISAQQATTKDYGISPYEWRVGKMLRIFADGIVSSGGVASNLTVALGMGGTPTTVCATPATALGTGSVSNTAWRMEARVRCTALGSTGTTMEGKGTFIMGDTASPAFATANAVMLDMALTTAAIDTTTTCAIMLRGTLSSANGSITCQSFEVYSVN